MELLTYVYLILSPSTLPSSLRYQAIRQSSILGGLSKFPFPLRMYAVALHWSKVHKWKGKTNSSSYLLYPCIDLNNVKEQPACTSTRHRDSSFRVVHFPPDINVWLGTREWTHEFSVTRLYIRVWGRGGIPIAVITLFKQSSFDKAV
jgi:hypothetical protein